MRSPGDRDGERHDGDGVPIVGEHLRSARVHTSDGDGRLTRGICSCGESKGRGMVESVW